MSEAPADPGNPSPTSDPADGGDGGSPAFDISSLSDRPVLELVTDEALKAEPSLKDFKGIDQLAQSYVSTKRMVGGDASQFVKIPTDDMTDEQRAEVLNKLGRPAEAGDYKEPDFEGMAELNLSDDAIKGFRDVAHQAGLTAGQYQAVMDYYFKYAHGLGTEFAERLEAQRADVLQGLQREWGDAYEQNVTLAQDAVKELGSDELVDFLEESGLGDDPRLIKFAYEAAKLMQEDDKREPGTGHFGTRLAPEDAKAEIKRLQGDSEFTTAYYNEAHPNHDNAVKRMQRLFQQAYPEPKR